MTGVEPLRGLTPFRESDLVSYSARRPLDPATQAPLFKGDLPCRFWIAPDGDIYMVGSWDHEAWAAARLRSQPDERDLTKHTVTLFRLGWSSVVYDETEPAIRVRNRAISEPAKKTLRRMAMDRNCRLVCEYPDGGELVWWEKDTVV